MQILILKFWDFRHKHILAISDKIHLPNYFTISLVEKINIIVLFEIHSIFNFTLPKVIKLILASITSHAAYLTIM